MKMYWFLQLVVLATALDLAWDHDGWRLAGVLVIGVVFRYIRNDLVNQLSKEVGS